MLRLGFAAVLLGFLGSGCTVKASTECRDKLGSSCATWAGPLYNYCEAPEKEALYMRINCAKTCNACAPLVCSDMSDECDSWGSDGFCDSTHPLSNFMKVNCNSTCGYCTQQSSDEVDKSAEKQQDNDLFYKNGTVGLLITVVVLVIGWVCIIVFIKFRKDSAQNATTHSTAGKKQKTLYEAPLPYEHKSDGTGQIYAQLDPYNSSSNVTKSSVMSESVHEKPITLKSNEYSSTSSFANDSHSEAKSGNRVWLPTSFNGVVVAAPNHGKSPKDNANQSERVRARDYLRARNGSPNMRSPISRR